ncbi:unnamed protein product [Didymodactylos carnosus]|uniref:Uncharacterized protein n=1 Tax=Didymodactylos carnosus TaxID=1234261 RepID=A0A8S2IJA5_9BILA|nr:unnamed protein product [Didymodactylos carnosus]CAF3750829.1 unnamed protein product [Didymodactylos carnosus]
MWTTENGKCLAYPEKSYETIENFSKSDSYYFSQCAFSNELHPKCNCEDNKCLPKIHENCPSNLPVELQEDDIIIIKYPTKSVFTPYYSRYSGNVEYFSFHHSIKCIGYQGYMPNELYYNANENFFYVYDMDTIFCSQGTPNLNGPQYDEHCWKNLPNSRSYHFLYSHRCISMYRIRDGIYDCPHGDDEEMNCSIYARKNRFRCGEEETCLLAGMLGNLNPDCQSNNRDEYIQQTDTKLSNMFCLIDNSKECKILKVYIRQSQIISTYMPLELNSTTNQTISLSSALPNKMNFNQYCDSFWNLKWDFDELSSFCRDWICPPYYYQCRTGQCIPIDWVCNNEWDCSDASDEQGVFLIDELSEHNFAILNRCEYRGTHQPFSDICNLTTDYPCFLINIEYNLTIRKKTFGL